MNLKEAFRYQNFLDRLLNQTMATMSIQDNLLEVSKVHRRSKAISSAEDETEVAEVTELVVPDTAISLALSIVKEKDALTKAIGVAKGNTALLDAINQALKELTEDGTIQKIIDKYIPSDAAADAEGADAAAGDAAGAEQAEGQSEEPAA